MVLNSAVLRGLHWIYYLDLTLTRSSPVASLRFHCTTFLQDLLTTKPVATCGSQMARADREDGKCCWHVLRGIDQTSRYPHDTVQNRQSEPRNWTTFRFIIPAAIDDAGSILRGIVCLVHTVKHIHFHHISINKSLTRGCNFQVQTFFKLIFDIFWRNSGKSPTTPYQNHDENRSRWQWITFTTPSLLQYKPCANLDWFNFTQLIPSGRVPEALHVAKKKEQPSNNPRAVPLHHLDLRPACQLPPWNPSTIKMLSIVICCRVCVCVIYTKAPIVRCGSIMGTRAQKGKI